MGHGHFLTKNKSGAGFLSPTKKGDYNIFPIEKGGINFSFGQFCIEQGEHALESRYSYDTESCN